MPCPTITKIWNPELQLERKRVAAYCRVSDTTDNLLNSYQQQIAYYKAEIAKHAEWELVGIYSDEGITGTNTRMRAGFNKLIADCDKGLIDLVLTKSISRFARDTVDFLSNIRHLKSIGVEVKFDKENLSTFSGECELLLSLLASFAQAESDSISTNIKWAIRKRFKEGLQNGHHAPYGYRWDGEMYRIVPEQGVIVREIFDRYLAGESAYSIGKNLGARGVLSNYNVPFTDSTVKDILKNYSYTGFQLLQKYHIEDHKRKTNHGDLPQFVVEDMYEPLITEEEYERVQVLRSQTASACPNLKFTPTVFSGKVKCGTCGSSMSRRDSGKKAKWVCNRKENKGKDSCPSRTILETELERAALTVITELEAIRHKVTQITVYDERVELKFKEGRTRAVNRSTDNSRLTVYSRKVICGECGGLYMRKIRTYRSGRKVIVWYCKGRCGNPTLLESTLDSTFSRLFRNNPQTQFLRYIKDVHVHKDKLVINYKEGDSKSCPR